MQEIEAARVEFEKAYQDAGFDLTLVKDSWDRPVYKHEHLESMFCGFCRGMTYAKEWQPIATAPDGVVRLWWKNNDWQGFKSQEIDSRGNRVWYIFVQDKVKMAADPTHWLPLNKPPKGE